MSRPCFSFRPNLKNGEHRKAWEVLCAIPKGTRTDFVVRAILECVQEERLQKMIREELKQVCAKPESEQPHGIPQEMLGFLGSLMQEE